MNKQSSQKIGKIFTYIVVVLLLVAVIGAVAYFTSGFTSEFKTFNVECVDKQLALSVDGYVFKYGEPTCFDVKYTFDKEYKGYSVIVKPKIDNDNDFDFTLDGQFYNFYGETDFTNGFNIIKKDTSFTIEPKGNLENIIKAVYPTYEVAISDNEVIDFGKDIFTLCVYSYNSKEFVSFDFKIVDFRIPKTLTLSEGVIIL